MISAGGRLFELVACVKEVTEFLDKPIPKNPEVGGVISVNHVAELVQHGVNDVFQWAKLLLVVEIAKAKKDLLTRVTVQTQELPVVETLT